MWQFANGGPTLTCYRRALTMARKRLAKDPNFPPLVRYLGKKPPWPNGDATKLDWFLRPPGPNGVFDYSIDPTWRGNPRP